MAFRLRSKAPLLLLASALMLPGGGDFADDGRSPGPESASAGSRGTRDATAAVHSSTSPKTLDIVPLAFESAGPRAGRRQPTAFRAKGAGYELYLDRGAATLRLEPGQPRHAGSESRQDTARTRQAPGGARRDAARTVSFRLVGARKPAGEGLDPLAARANYFVGDDPKNWRREVPLFGRVRFAEVYPGVDLVYHGAGRELEHDFVVAPGADPRAIRFAVAGADSVRIDAAGDLVLAAGGEELRLRKPVAYQEKDGVRREIAAALEVGPRGEAGFRLGDYDRTSPLVIDPVISYSTYLGGTANFDNGYAVAYDAAGFAYVMGTTTLFPTTPGAFSRTPSAIDVFVAKLDTRQTGSASLVWATYIGGSGSDTAGGLAVDPAGNVFVSVGNYGGFPTTGSAYDKTYNGGADLGIAKLNPSGSSLLWSTYLGGNSNDGGSALAIDLSGAVVVGGSTTSNDFPTTSSAYRRTPIALGDLFLSVIGPEGDKLLYSTYFGGSGIYETIYGVALDGLGRAYMTGFTDSPDFPTTAGAFDRTLGGTGDAFVARLDPTLPGSVALGFGTYLGGSGANDTGHAIKLGPGDEPIILGYTDSYDLPGADTGYDGTIGGSDDMFVARLSNDGTNAPYVSYLGGSSSESLGPDSLEVDDFGRAHVGAETYSASYPSTAGAITACTSGGQVVYTVLDTEVGGAGSLVTSTCAGPAWGLGIGIDGCGRAAITGFTASAAYPTVGGYSASLGGTRDAFLMEISPSSGTGPADLAVSVSDSPDPVFVGQGVTHAIQVTNNGPNAATGVRVTHRMSALVTIASLPPECTGSGATVVCDLGTIPSGTTVPLAIAATAPLPGSLWAISKVSSASDDPDCSDNAGTAVTTVKNATLNLDAPNGGMTYASGSTVSIDWTAPGTAATFNLDYTMDNGTTWVSIAKGVGGRTYSWQVPAARGNKPKSKVRVKAFDALGKAAGSDGSDAAFTIEVMRLTSPNGGEDLASGANQEIAWATNATLKPVAKTRLQYTINGGSTWKTIATLTGNPGSYAWTVPAVSGAKPNCKVRVTLLDSAGASLGKDLSDAAFTMHP